MIESGNLLSTTYDIDLPLTISAITIYHLPFTICHSPFTKRSC